MKHTRNGATGPATPVRANKSLRAGNIHRLMAHASEVVLFDGPDDEGLTEKTENIALGDLEHHRTEFSTPYLDLRDDEDRVLALIRPLSADDGPTPSAFLHGPDGPLAVNLLKEPIPLPENWLDAVPIDAEIEWAEDGALFELVGKELVRCAADVDKDPVPASAGEAPVGASAVPVEDNTLNAATIIGTDTEKFKAALARPAQIMVGAMYGAHNKKNTQDGDWAIYEAPLIQLIQGFDGVDGAPEFGFSRHTEAKRKEGPCIVMGSSLEGARKAKAMKTMHFIGLDIDSGARMEDVVKTIEKKGIFALVHTSFNHGKSGLQLKRDEVLRKLQIKTDPSVGQIQDYLRNHDKNRYEESFIQAVSIKEAKKQVKDGVVIELDTPPLHKFRLFFPLAEPVEIVAQAETHQGALDDWEDAVTGLAHSVLGIHFDTSCTDPSRLFFTARHPRGNDEWKSVIIMGDPLEYQTIPRVKKSTYTKNRELNAFVQADDGEGPAKIDQIWLPSGADLNRWHSLTGKSRLMLADLLETYCPDKIRVAGGEKGGSVHTECPFEHEHTTEGGTGTMAINCLDNENGFWTWFCQHDACQGRHKTALLGEAINRGWFDEELLDSDEFLLPPEDDEIGEDEIEALKEVAANPSAEPKGPKPIEVLLDEIDFDGSGVEEMLRKLYKRLHKRGIDKVEQARVHKLLKDRSGLDLNTLKGFWRDLDRDQYQKERDENNRTAPIVTEADFDVMVEYAVNRITAANAEEPRLFHYMERFAVVRGADGAGKIKLLDRDGVAHVLNRLTRFQGKVTEKKSRHVAAPEPVVRDLFSGDPGQIVPRLRGVVTSPTFSAKGQIIMEEGYHYESGLYYEPHGGVTIPVVPMVPTEDEVHEAKRLLIDEVFADFPLGGRTRPEIVQECLYGDGIPAVTHLLAFTLLPFCRDLIDGPTPGHLVVKPTPGTGASLLAEVASIISTGTVTPSMAMPGKTDEMGKTLTSVLANGQNIVFFDNINDKVDSAELASALTAKTYAARILGKSQTVETEVRCAWILTGNNAHFSVELVRRLIMVDLDAQCANPERRTGFKHADLRGWVEKNRGLLVWACLTLIQNWVAKGMPDSGAAVQASYENWSRVMGGILHEAGIGGFLGNRDKLRVQASESDSGPDVQMMMLLAREYEDGQHFRVTGNADFGKGESVVKTVALLTILNDHNMIDGVEPIVLDSTDYTHDRETGFFSYANPPKFKKALKRLVGKTYNFEMDDQVRTAVLRHEFDSRNKSDLFVLEKKPEKKPAPAGGEDAE